MPKRFSRGWLVICMFVCINAYPARKGKKAESYGPNLNFADFRDKDYDYEDFSADKYVNDRDESSNEASEYDEVSSTTVRNNHVRLPLVLEPDAEMLPAHYTGVEPPGVDHMEIKSFDSSSMGSNRQSTVSDGTKVTTGNGIVNLAKTSRGANDESALQTNNDFKNGLTVESGKENWKGEYDEAAGKKKVHEEADKHVVGHEDETSREKSVDFKVDGQRDKGHNAAGYRNVYHKDEYKKDADFYDNDHESERFRKHGHYGEKHVAADSDFRKGGNRVAKITNNVAAKRGNFETLRDGEDSKGHKTNSGYSGFFNKSDNFAKQTKAGQLFDKNGEIAAKV